jgi:hypothetical protein
MLYISLITTYLVLSVVSHFCTLKTGTLPNESSLPETFLLGEKQVGVKLTTHLNLMPRLKMCVAIPPLPHMSAWHDV